MTVNDTQPPTITCPATVTAQAPPGQTSIPVTYPPPTAADNGPGVTTSCVPASGSSFNLGPTTVICTATDLAGNTATCNFTVRVDGNISGNVKQFVPGGPNTNLAGVTLTLTGPNGGTTTSDASGNYNFGGIRIGSGYSVIPSGLGKTYDPSLRDYFNVAGNITGADFVAYNAGQLPRNLRVGNAYPAPGEPAVVPIRLTALGTEAKVAFSLTYDTNFLSSPVVTCGASAPGCTIIANNTTPGTVGVTITPAAVFGAGLREVANVTFITTPGVPASTPVTFGDSPTARDIRDSSNNPLPSTYTDGLVVFALGLEGDLADRNTGDGKLFANDVTIGRQLVVGLLTADPAFNEYQRADTAPGPTKGDGQLDATDVIQERRYVAGLDPPVSAGGPGEPLGPPLAAAANPADDETARVMRVVPTTATPGREVAVTVELASQGDEVASSFTLNFDETKLTNPRVTLGSGMPSDATLTTNNAGGGRLGILVDSLRSFGANQFVTVTFDVPADASGGEASVAFTDTLAHRGTSDAGGNLLPTRYLSGAVTISGPASAGAEVSGRVLTPDGRGLRNAQVTLQDSAGVARTVTTNSFGFYTLGDVATGETYTIGVSARRYRFASRTLRITDSITDVDFTAQE